MQRNESFTKVDKQDNNDYPNAPTEKDSLGEFNLYVAFIIFVTIVVTVLIDKFGVPNTGLIIFIIPFVVTTAIVSILGRTTIDEYTQYIIWSLLIYSPLFYCLSAVSGNIMVIYGLVVAYGWWYLVCTFIFKLNWYYKTITTTMMVLLILYARWSGFIQDYQYSYYIGTLTVLHFFVAYMEYHIGFCGKKFNLCKAYMCDFKWRSK